MVKGEKCLGQSTSGILPNSYHLNNGLRLNSNPKQISSISPRGYKVVFQLWKIKLIKILSMSKMRMLDLKLFCPLEFEDFPPPFGSFLCLFNYKELITDMWNNFFNFPFSIRTPPRPAHAASHTHTLININTTSNPYDIMQTWTCSQTILCAHFIVSTVKNEHSYPMEKLKPTTIHKDFCKILCISEMAILLVNGI